MKIVVLIKTVEFVYAQTGTDLKKNYIGPDDILQILNPADELALEVALALRDADPATRVAALSLGDAFAAAGLRRSLAMGADEAIHIEHEASVALDPWARAVWLAAACRQTGFDLILCGAGAVDDNAGLTGQYVAQRLGIAHLSRVIRIARPEMDAQLQIERAIERGDRQLLSCRLPALFSVQKGASAARYPTLAGFLRARRQAVAKLLPGDLPEVVAAAPPASQTEVIEYVKPRPKKRVEEVKKVKMSAMERLKSITKREPAKKAEEGNVIEADSDQLFTRLDRILRDAGILS